MFRKNLFRAVFGDRFDRHESIEDDDAYRGDEEIASGPVDRLACLAQLRLNLQEELNMHAAEGLSPRGSMPSLSAFHFHEQAGALVAHAANNSCRVTIYLSGVIEKNERIADGLREVAGTCKQFRRSRCCMHTLAAANALLKVLDDRAHPLREQLFHLRQTEQWRSVLKLVDQFLVAAPQQVTEPEQPQTRLVWRVQYDYRQLPGSQPNVALDVSPFEQKIGKGGQWTKGRRVSPQQFTTESDLLTHEIDRRIALKCRAAYGYGYGRRNLSMPPHDILAELIGHPLVFWADRPEVAVEVTRGQFGAAAVEVPGGWRILPAIDGTVREGETVWNRAGSGFTKPLWIDRAGNRIVLADADPALVTLVARLGAVPDAIPAEGQAEVLNRLALLQNRLPITLPQQLSAGTEAADPRLVLRLTPQQPAGVLAEMVVVPVAYGASFPPGAGPASLSMLRDGKQYAYQRELAAERRRAMDAAEQLRLAMFPSPRPFVWHLHQNEDCLDLLAALSDEPIEGLIVQWPEGAKRTVSTTVQPSALRVQVTQQQDWFGLNGTVEIDGEAVELARVLHAMRQGHRYVEVGANQFVRLAKQLRQSLEALDDACHETKAGKLELDITSAPAIEQLCDPSVEWKACKAWNESLRKLREAQELHPEPPISLQADLRDYQLDGYRWLRRLAAWGMGGCLADDMGLGKTVQTLAVLIDRMEEGPALVIAPTSVAFNWSREAARFAPTLRPILYRETDRDDVLQNLSPGDVLVVSYGLLLRDMNKLAKVSWGTLVLDEAQKVKNSVTKTAQAVRQIDAKWRLALTGTPLENHLGELWSIFRAVCPGLLGSWERFRTRFAEPIERQQDASRRRGLARIIRPFILRRTKAEVLEELPQRTEIIRTAELTAAEKERYQAARLAAVANLALPGQDEAIEDRRFQVLAALTRLRQLACHPRLVDADWPGGSAKLELFMEIVEELREGNHRALVFSQFVQHLSLIRGALDAAGISYQYLDGQTPAAQRENLVDAFQRGEGELFLISLKAGGTGLNLTAADYVIHMDPWWNPAVEDQATDRTHRIGQTRPVTVYRLVAKDTIEEQILALHASKRHLVSDVLSGTDQAAKLSTQELVELIRGEAEEETTAASSGRER